MLTPDQVKPLLSHADRFIRAAAAEYFGESFSADPDIVPQLVANYRAHGTFEDRQALYQCRRLAVSEAGLQSLLDLLVTSPPKSVVRMINEVVEWLPVELVRANRERLAEHPDITSYTMEALEERLALAERPAEELWQELQDMAASVVTTEDDDEGLDTVRADELIDALAPHAVPDEATILQRLAELNRKELSEAEGWLELFLVQLAGRRRLRAAVPLLVERYHVDADYTLEETSEALARIGDPEASRLIAQVYPTAEEHFQWHALMALESIKHEESERALLELLGVERDQTRRTLICSALCRLFSEKGLPLVLKEIEKGYDRSMVHLEGDALAVADVLGQTLPLGDIWRAERERESARQAELQGQWEQEAEEEFSSQDFELDRQELPEMLFDVEPEDRSNRLKPFVHTEQRVGRNDPCPCGSGKKFKKCCGKSGD